MDDATDGPGGAPIDPYPLDTVWQTLLVEPTFTLTAWLALPLEQRPGLIDLRPESDYYSRHINGATSLPYPFGVDRARQMPPKQFFEDKAMMSKLFTDLRSKHYPVRNFFVESDSLWEELAAAGVVELHSRSTRRLWLPSPVLDGVIEEIERLRMADGLPPHGHAIDLACGAGRDGVFLGLRGWSSDNYDWSETQIRRVEMLAKEFVLPLLGVSHLVNAQDTDVTQSQNLMLQRRKCDLLNVSRFLDRTLWSFFKELLNPGGFIVYHTFMMSCKKPKRDAFKLKRGELARVFSDFEIVVDKEFTISDGRLTSYFVARKPKVTSVSIDVNPALAESSVSGMKRKPESDADGEVEAKKAKINEL